MTDAMRAGAGWAGGPVTARATCVLAPNPGPMTLDGTNTWVLREPGARRSVVVDPGPLHDAHLAAVLEHATTDGGRVGLVLLTHAHPDHAEGAARFAELARASVRAADPHLGAEGLQPGEVLDVEGLRLRLVPTPGHTSDSWSFLLPDDAALLTGDTVLGRGTTVVAHPDGRLADYLDSLHRLQDLVTGAAVALLPGHGPAAADSSGVLQAYLTHRRARLDQVRAAVAAGDTTAEQVVARVYADVDRKLWPAAARSVEAQLEYLRQHG
ncbi:MAG: MBL fold metallo-hydrolase [Actinomycetales bacterium]